MYATIEPEPSDAEREAILAALGTPDDADAERVGGGGARSKARAGEPDP